MPPRAGFTFSQARHYLPYFLLILIFVAGVWLILAAGSDLQPITLFIGVAMSITAFPVLARILEDRGLSQTTLGSIAITCAAVDDVTAWCILALVTTFMTGPLLSLVKSK